MGQQQLLLLVLATVIVGLATIAGIQAFDTGLKQANRDQLTQRAISIGTDILAAHKKPKALGGIDLDPPQPSDDRMAAVVGINSDDDGGSIPADGVGKAGVCDIDTEVDTDLLGNVEEDGENAYVHCGNKSLADATGGESPRGIVVTVRINPNPEEEPFDDGVSVVSIKECPLEKSKSFCDLS